MKITTFDDLYPLHAGVGGGVVYIASGSNSGAGDTSSGGDVTGSPGDYSVVGLRRTVSLASNIGGGTVGDVLTIIGTSPRLAMFATPSNTGGAAFGSNTTRVSEVASVGFSSNTSRADHIHDGIGQITASSSNTLQRGTFNLRAGNNVSIGYTDSDGDGELDTATIHATATGGGGGGGGVTDYVSGASGTGQIIIPGLAGSPDIRVAGTNDDEFDTTDTSDPMTGWTTLGTPTSHDINSTFKSHYFVSKSSGGVSLTGIYKAWSPSAGAVVTCKLSGFTGWDSNSQTRGGLFVAEASPGKIVSIARGGGVAGLLSTVWTNPTTYASNPTTQTMYGTTVWLRIRYNSSTSLDYEYSLDGMCWWKHTAAHNPSMTVGSVGLFIVPNNAAGTVSAAFDWIRFS